MTLTFVPTRDGYFVTNDQGRAVARIETKHTIHVQETQPPDGRVVRLEKTEALPQEKWPIHFCAGKRTLAELTALLAQMPEA